MVQAKWFEGRAWLLGLVLLGLLGLLGLAWLSLAFTVLADPVTFLLDGDLLAVVHLDHAIEVLVTVHRDTGIEGGRASAGGTGCLGIDGIAIASDLDVFATRRCPVLAQRGDHVTGFFRGHALRLGRLLSHLLRHLVA